MSSPFPTNSSTPPTPIEVGVDSEFAFLSTLVPDAGAVKDVPSPNVVPGVPKLTASTTVPDAREPLMIARLLSFAIVPLPDASQESTEDKLVLHQRKKPWAGTDFPEANATIVALVVPLVFFPSRIPLSKIDEDVGL